MLFCDRERKEKLLRKIRSDRVGNGQPGRNGHLEARVGECFKEGVQWATNRW